jgi:lipoyl(octanoyl) transferase
MLLRQLGLVDYLPTYEAMQAFTAARTPETPDQLWLCEHPPVYTLGLASKAEHLLNTAQIPVVQTNRGGQVTFHGPGQVVAYPLLELKRAGYFIKEYVYRIEEAVLRTLLHFGVTGHRVAGAPGIYVRLDDPTGHALLAQRPVKKKDATRDFVWDPELADQVRNDALERARITVPDFTGLGKIAALGIKLSRNCTYHGVALNVAMDLEPFSRINPCGYIGLQTVDLSTIGICVERAEVADLLGRKLLSALTP